MDQLYKNSEIKDVDPRIAIILEKVDNISRIIGVGSCKGGVGKSVIAGLLSLALRDKDISVGLLDLDIFGPSLHVILGVKHVFPKEDKGLVPPLIHGIKFMSIYYFLKDNAITLRGGDLSNLIKEILAITRWDNIDYLIIDLPPGSGDETLDIISLIPKIKLLIVTTPSLVSLEVVKRYVKLLKELEVNLLGILGNMVRKESEHIFINKLADELGVNYLGSLPFDNELEQALGSIEKLTKTKLYNALNDIVRRLIKRKE